MSAKGPLREIVVKICKDKDENPPSIKGSGFFISPTEIATCHHVLSTDKKIVGKFWCKRFGSKYWIEANPIYTECNEEKDKALLSAKTLEREGESPEISFDFFSEWDEQSKNFISLGFDNNNAKYGIHLTEVEGEINTYLDTSSGNVQLDLKVTKGAMQDGRSGSPVWSKEQNSIIGMIAKIFSKDINFDGVAAIPISDIISDLRIGKKSSYYYRAIEGLSPGDQGKPNERTDSAIDIQVFRESIEEDLEEFYTIRDKKDPFQRLAWLILEHENILGENIIGPALNTTFSISEGDAIFKNYVQMLYDYQELQIENRFPDSIIEKLKPNFRNLILDIDDWECDVNSNSSVEIKKWLRFDKNKFPIMQTSNSLAHALNELNKAREELDNRSLDIKNIRAKVSSAFDRSERLLQQLLSFYEYAIYGKNLEIKEDMDFIYYVQQLRRLDQAIAIACSCSNPKDAKEEQERNFGSIFQRQRLFQNQRESDHIKVPVKEGNQINWKDLRIKEQCNSTFIESLEELIKLRDLYKSGSKDFLHNKNKKNIKNGAIKILISFIELWESSEKTIFPKVVFIRRILQVDANRTRLDYTSLVNPRDRKLEESLERIWIETKSLPSYTLQLLGKEVYLWVLYEKDGIVSKLLLYPVDEEMWEAIK
jgi:hypothetical protein